jgi:transcriptional regulator with XRE-family HTH domain
MKQSTRDIKNKEELKKMGARLRYFRKQKEYGQTAEAAAFKLGVQRSQYSRYEAGQNINYLTLVELLDKMDVSISEFFSEGFD